MVDMPSPSFDRPIPGQSLTAELGSRPWQQPPQYTTVEEALEYYIPRLTNPELLPQLLDVMETGIPLTTIANAMQVAGVMEGKHSIDVGILIMPVLIETMAYLAEEADVEYETGSNKTVDSDLIDESRIALALSKSNIEPEEELEEPIEEQSPEENILGGLMARRNKDGV